jgi:hypothetical protein
VYGEFIKSSLLLGSDVYSEFMTLDRVNVDLALKYDRNVVVMRRGEPAARLL